MKLSQDYKWRRLRRWLHEVRLKAERNGKNPQLAYHWRTEKARAEAFQAVLMVMDAENRRVRRKSSQGAPHGL